MDVLEGRTTLTSILVNGGSNDYTNRGRSNLIIYAEI